MVSCARATRGLGRPSLNTRSGRPIRPPFREKRTSKLGGIICGRARGTRVLRALVYRARDWPRRAMPMVVFRHFAELTPAGASRSLAAFRLLKLCTLEKFPIYAHRTLVYWTIWKADAGLVVANGVRAVGRSKVRQEETF